METQFWSGLSAVANAFMVLITAGGFFFVWRQLTIANDQLKNDHRTSEAATVEHLYCRMHDIHRMFIEYPELRDFFYRSRALSPDDPPELKVRVDAATELMADFFQQVFLELELLPAPTRAGWRSYMTAILGTSQVTRAYVDNHRHWYPSNFVDQLLNPQS